MALAPAPALVPLPALVLKPAPALALTINGVSEILSTTFPPNQDFHRNSEIFVEVKKRKLIENEIENESGGTCEGERGLCPPLGPPVGRFPCFVSVFVFVLIFDFSNFDFRNI